jgi:hypothetical protein
MIEKNKKYSTFLKQIDCYNLLNKYNKFITENANKTYDVKLTIEDINGDDQKKISIEISRNIYLLILKIIENERNNIEVKLNNSLNNTQSDNSDDSDNSSDQVNKPDYGNLTINSDLKERVNNKLIDILDEIKSEYLTTNVYEIGNSVGSMLYDKIKTLNYS